MKNEKLSTTLAGAGLLALTLMPTIATSQVLSDVQSNGNLHLKESGSFYIQGNIISETAVESGLGIAGLRMVNQM